jgi:hypothetical protein
MINHIEASLWEAQVALDNLLQNKESMQDSAKAAESSSKPLKVSLASFPAEMVAPCVRDPLCRRVYWPLSAGQTGDSCICHQ